jgi:DNA-binding transcriptional LysR family regulator
MPALTVAVAVETSDKLLEQLARGDLDVVVGRLVEGYARRDYRMEPLQGEALALVVRPGHRLARKRGVRLQDLAGMPWVLQPKGSPMRELLEHELRAGDMDLPADLVETSSILTTAGLVLDGDHVAVLPSEVARRYAEHGMFAVLPVRLARELEPYGSIVHRARPLSAAAQCFLRELRRCAGLPAAAGRRS